MPITAVEPPSITKTGCVHTQCRQESRLALVRALICVARCASAILRASKTFLLILGAWSRILEADVPPNLRGAADGRGRKNLPPRWRAHQAPRRNMSKDTQR